MAASAVSNKLFAVQNSPLAIAHQTSAAQGKASPSSSAPLRCCCSSRPFLSGTPMRSKAGTASFQTRIGRRESLSRKGETQCGLLDYVGRDLLRFDVGKWYDDVEQNGAMAMYMPLEGGPEGRYVLKLKNEGYNILNLSARGLGDPEAYLMKVHGVRPAHYGKEPITTFYAPPEIDYRLSLLPPDSKGLVLWLTDGKVLSRAELQFLILIPVLRKNVRVVVELGGARQVEWYPLKEIVGLPPPNATISGEESKTGE